MARDEIVERRSAAAVRNLIGLGADLIDEQHAAKVTERSDAGVRDLGVLPRLLHPFHQLRHVAGRQVLRAVMVEALVLTMPMPVRSFSASNDGLG